MFIMSEMFILVFYHELPVWAIYLRILVPYTEVDIAPAYQADEDAWDGDGLRCLECDCVLITSQGLYT